MNGLDYAVLFGSVLAIALYGILRTLGRRNLHDYLRGRHHSWLALGLSVMATQASAVTFLSTPGQGYGGGLSFVQNYFALPLAMVVIAVFILPIYRKLNVYTAYEFLGTRFDKKTRLLAAAIFLLQRALNAGYTVYAPAIILSTVFGWPLWSTIVASGLVVTLYTALGGSDAVTHTQKYQFAIILAGMVIAFGILVSRIPCSFTDSLTLAGHFGKLNAVSFSLDPKTRYTFWTGMLGGIFLMLSYFGTDQSQVQRYISGDDLRESRLGLMFNAVMKIPMQFFILLLGVMLFVFYLFHQAPVAFNQQEYARSSSVAVSAPDGQQSLDHLEEHYGMYEENSRAAIESWYRARNEGNSEAAAAALDEAILQRSISARYRGQMAEFLKSVNPSHHTNDSDYVFITFILDNLPHGLIGLLVACFFFATLSSKAGELNALTACSIIDFYRYLIRPPSQISNQHSEPGTQSPISLDSSLKSQVSDRHYVLASKAFTIFWGLLAIAFALFLFRYFAENLIQATNIVGSIFYGGLLGLFLIAFFLKFIRGTAAFWGAVIGQSVVFIFVLLNALGTINLAYLWYNAIGCCATVTAAILLQFILRTPPPDTPGFPVLTNSAHPEDSAPSAS